MKNQNFSCSITTVATADEVLSAISRVDQWWAKTFEGSAQHLNDVFTVRFGTTNVTFRVTGLVPGKRVVWDVIDCYLPWLQDKTEWTGTKVIFDISSDNDLTTVDFTHEGLKPGIECYDQCVKGWTGHIAGSLARLLAQGEGQPA